MLWLLDILKEYNELFFLSQSLVRGINFAKFKTHPMFICISKLKADLFYKYHYPTLNIINSIKIDALYNNDNIVYLQLYMCV